MLFYSVQYCKRRYNKCHLAIVTDCDCSGRTVSFLRSSVRHRRTSKQEAVNER